MIDSAEGPLRFEKEGIAYQVRVEPDGDAVRGGVENLLAEYRLAGHSFAGISDPSLEQYGTLGEPASLTDNRVFDPSLGIDEVKGERSGRRDLRVHGTGRGQLARENAVESFPPPRPSAPFIIFLELPRTI